MVFNDQSHISSSTIIYHQPSNQYLTLIFPEGYSRRIGPGTAIREIWDGKWDEMVDEMI